MDCSDHCQINQRNRDPFAVKILIAERDSHRQETFVHDQDIRQKNGRNNDLSEHFLLRKQTVGSSKHNFQIIIQKSDDTKAQCQKQNRDDVRISADKEKRGDQHTDQNDQSSHSRRACFFKMGLYTFGSFRLTDLQSFQEWDNDRTQDDTDCKGCQQCNDYFCTYFHIYLLLPHNGGLVFWLSGRLSATHNSMLV